MPFSRTQNTKHNAIDVNDGQQQRQHRKINKNKNDNKLQMRESFFSPVFILGFWSLFDVVEASERMSERAIALDCIKLVACVCGVAMFGMARRTSFEKIIIISTLTHTHTRTTAHIDTWPNVAETTTGHNATINNHKIMSVCVSIHPHTRKSVETTKAKAKKNVLCPLHSVPSPSPRTRTHAECVCTNMTTTAIGDGAKNCTRVCTQVIITHIDFYLCRVVSLFILVIHRWVYLHGRMLLLLLLLLTTTTS